VPSYPFPLRVLSQSNQGPAAARNRGIAQAEAPCIAFTDDDCVPEPGWLAALLAAWTGDADCAGLGGRTLRLEAHPLARYIDYIGSLQPSRHPEGHLNYVVTCNALFRRDALQAVGGFDTRITWAGGEEPILGAELRAAGYYFSEAPLAEVRHQHPRGWRALFRMYHRYGRGEWAGSQLGARRGYSGNLLYFIKLFLLDGLYILIRPQVSLRDKLPFLFFSTVKALGSVRGWSHQRKAAGAWPSPKFPLQTTSHDA
jgi:GT2 family glycosyltransferase